MSLNLTHNTKYFIVTFWHSILFILVEHNVNNIECQIVRVGYITIQSVQKHYTNNTYNNTFPKIKMHGLKVI
jgi:hypothetical protein